MISAVRKFVLTAVFLCFTSATLSVRAQILTPPDLNPPTQAIQIGNYILRPLDVPVTKDVYNVFSGFYKGTSESIDPSWIGFRIGLVEASTNKSDFVSVALSKWFEDLNPQSNGINVTSSFSHLGGVTVLIDKYGTSLGLSQRGVVALNFQDTGYALIVDVYSEAFFGWGNDPQSQEALMEKLSYILNKLQFAVADSPPAPQPFPPSVPQTPSDGSFIPGGEGTPIGLGPGLGNDGNGGTPDEPYYENFRLWSEQYIAYHNCRLSTIQTDNPMSDCDFLDPGPAPTP